jgi:hypothetical protein
LFTLREEHRLKEAKNWVPRRIFGLKGDEVTGEWRTPHAYNREFNDLYSSQNIIWAIKLRRMRWEGHVALCRRGEVYTECWWGNLRERDHFEDPGVDGRKIL